MIGQKYLITFVVGLCLCSNGWSQADEAYFTQLTTMDGLSSNSIEAIHQDHQGLIWIKTLNGLDRYDGVEFINHSTYPDGRMETGKFIIEDSLGNLWYNQSLTKYDRAKDTSYLMQGNYLSESINLSGITSAQMGPDQHLYLAKWEGSLLIVDPFDPDSVVEWALPKLRAPFDYITKIQIGPDNHFWMGTNQGLFRYEQNENSMLPIEGIEYPKNQHISDFLFDNEENLWIAFTCGLVKYNFQQQSTEYFQFSEEVAILPFSVIQSANGNIIIGASRGLYYLKPGQDQIKKLLGNVAVTSIYQDQAHNLWIGTQADGVFLGNSEFNAVKELSLNIRNQSLSPYSVSNILEDGTGGLWIYEHESGLLYHDLRTGKTHEIDTKSRIGGMVYLDKELWYCTNDQLLCYQKEDASIHRFNLPQIRPIVETKWTWKPKISSYGDKLLIHSQYDELYSFNPESKEFKQVEKNKTFGNLFEVIDEKVFLGVSNNGILVIDINQDKTELLSFHQNVTSILEQSDIVLHKDRFGSLWLGGWGALCKLNEKTREFETVNDFQKTNLIVNNILEDSLGNLWIGTTYGLYKYDQKRDYFTHLGPGQGLPSGRVWVSCSAQTSDGEMYFGIRDGVIHFHPDKIPLNDQVPPLVLNSFKVLPKFQKNDEANELLSQSQIHSGQEIHLKYWQNSFTVKFASLNYISPQQNQYQYRLAGLEDEWNSVGNQSRATYTSLRGGSYTFEVKGSNNVGVWNEEPCQLFIHLDSPPWWTWWSITLYVLALLAVMLAIYLYNMRRLRLQYQLEMKSKESESLQEINRAKSQFFTNISHEFRTPLSLILDPAEQLFTDKQIPPKQKRFAKLILNNSKRLLFLTNQILDLAKLDNDRIKLKVEETDLRELLNPTVQAFKSGAEAVGLNYRILFPDQALMVWVDRDRIEQVVVNLLSNAFKYCSQGEIAIELLEKDDFVWIHVRDTGLGIPAEQVDHIFDNYYQVEREESKHAAGTGIGLYLVKELVTLHHGTVQVKSEVNIGSTFSVCLQKGKKHFLPSQFNSGSQPAEDETEQPGAKSDPNQPDKKLIPHTTNPSLLVIEDNPDMMQYLADVLSEEYSILKAKDGEEGFRKALELNPDIVISDVMMPVLDGYAFCDKMKKDDRTSHIPVILLTAKTMHAEKINGLQLGADDYLQKPFHLDELKLRIRYHLELRKKVQEEFVRKFKISSGTEMALSVNDKLLQTIFAHIEKHLLDEQFGVEKLSKIVGMSAGHLNNKIKSLTNQTTNELIRNFRLRKAAYLISEIGISVTEACYEVGFNNPSYFSKVFFELYGTRPSDYSKSE